MSLSIKTTYQSTKIHTNDTIILTHKIISPERATLNITTKKLPRYYHTSTDTNSAKMNIILDKLTSYVSKINIYNHTPDTAHPTSNTTDSHDKVPGIILLNNIHNATLNQNINTITKHSY